jgi:hypothetical protein
VTNNQGIILADIKRRPPLAHIAQAKPIKIFSKACPDIILANNRILRLRTFAKYETSSIIIKKGLITKGTPLGKNKLTKCHP